MADRSLVRWAALAAASTVLASGVAVAAVAEQRAAGPTVRACANKQTGALRVARPACRSTERRVSWAVRGPRGLRGLRGATGLQGGVGPQGPAGTLDTTPINVSYAAVRSSGHNLEAVNGITMILECGNSRIGENGVNAVVYADEVHGTSSLTRYNASGSVVDSSTATINTSGTATSLPSASVNPPTATHVTEYFTAVVSEGGIVHTLDLYLTRDTRQNRPVCEFIGTLAAHGPATVVPS